MKTPVPAIDAQFSISVPQWDSRNTIRQNGSMAPFFDAIAPGIVSCTGEEIRDRS